MNRSLLLIICDFLLLSLLGFARFDLPNEEVVNQQVAEPLESTGGNTETDEIIEALKMSLRAEQNSADNLKGELSDNQKLLSKQLDEQEEALRQKEEELLQKEQALLEKNAVAEKLARAKKALQEKVDQFQANLTEKEQLLLDKNKSLNETRSQLGKAISTVDNLLEEKNTETNLKAEAQKQLALAVKDREFLASIVNDSKDKADADNAKLRTLTREKLSLQSELQQAVIEKQYIRKNLNSLQAEKKVLVSQTTKLAEGVKSLATNTSELNDKIEEIKPKTQNEIFKTYEENSVSIEFNITKDNLIIGSSEKKHQTESLFIRHSGKTFAIFHSSKTPFQLISPSHSMTAITGNILVKGRKIEIREIGFLKTDPRLLIVPVNASVLQKLNIQPFDLAENPFFFTKAVLINRSKGYFGEAEFKLSRKNPSYLKVNAKIFSRLFGEFSPSRGDIVFSKTGEIIGMMSNHLYTVHLQNFDISHFITLGESFSKKRTGKTLDQLADVLDNKPLEHQ